MTPYPSDLGFLVGHEQRSDNWCWRPHGTPVPLLIHTRSGRGVVRVGPTEEHMLGPGDTVLWAAGAPQEFGCGLAGQPWGIVWAHYWPRSHWRGWLSWPILGPGVTRILAPQPRILARVDAALLEVVSAGNSPSAWADDFALNALERALLWLDAANPRPGRLDERIHDAVLFVAGHLDRQLSVGVIAEAVQLSPSRLGHLFKEQMGISPARFVELRRIERAQSLLQSSSLPIRAVADVTGFSTQFYFANRFRAVTGMSPTTWRKRAASSVR